jgi:GT2 family glycosyltransferase
MRYAVSVVIPHYDDLDNLRLCLKHLATQTLPRDSFEVIIADNNSPMGIEAVRDVAKNQARVVQAPEQGAGPARNAGVDATCGDVLAFIDSDCRPNPDWLERGIAALRNTDIVGGRVDIVAKNASHPTAAEAFEMVFAFPIRDYIERKGFAVTANLFVPRPVYDRVGLFRSAVAEDVEWCKRATTLGFRLAYASDAVVEHPARATWLDLQRKWRRTTSETYFLMREGQWGKVKWLRQCMLVLISIAPHGAALITTSRLTGVWTRIAAFSILVRIRTYRVIFGTNLMFSKRSRHKYES